MWDLVGNSDDMYSHYAAQLKLIILQEDLAAAVVVWEVALMMITWYVM